MQIIQHSINEYILYFPKALEYSIQIKMIQTKNKKPHMCHPGQPSVIVLIKQ